jgi:hypothetical protein
MHLSLAFTQVVEQPRLSLQAGAQAHLAFARNAIPGEVSGRLTPGLDGPTLNRRPAQAFYSVIRQNPMAPGVLVVIGSRRSRTLAGGSSFFTS